VVGFISHLQCCQKSIEVVTGSGPFHTLLTSPLGIVLFLTTGYLYFTYSQFSDLRVILSCIQQSSVPFLLGSLLALLLGCRRSHHKFSIIHSGRLPPLAHWLSLYCLVADQWENTLSNSPPIVLHVFIAVETYSNKPLPSSGSLCNISKIRSFSFLDIMSQYIFLLISLLAFS
jgi:hypothetical protein